MILPIGHEESSVRRLPWVSFAVMALCVLAFLVTKPSSSATDEGVDELGDMRALPQGEQIGMEFWKNEDDQWVARSEKTVPFLRFAGSSTNDPRALRLRELLNLDPEKFSFPIVDVDFSPTETGQRQVGNFEIVGNSGGHDQFSFFDPEMRGGVVLLPRIK